MTDNAVGVTGLRGCHFGPMNSATITAPDGTSTVIDMTTVADRKAFLDSLKQKAAQVKQVTDSGYQRETYLA
jgi:hypothetical protein